MTARPLPRLLGALALAMLLAADGSAQDIRDLTLSRRVGEEEKLRVEVLYGAGRLQIGPAKRGLLYRTVMRYDRRAFEPMTELKGDTLRIGIKNVKADFNPNDATLEENRLQLFLARDLPLELVVGFGAGDAKLDLGGISMSKLEVRTALSQSLIDFSTPNRIAMSEAKLQAGAVDFAAENLGNLNAKKIDVAAGVGSVKLNFEGEWKRDAEVSVNMGLGALLLEFPEGLGVRIEEDALLSSFDPQGLVKRGDYYYSLDWEEAKRRITVKIKGALGQIKVAWTED